MLQLGDPTALRDFLVQEFGFVVTFDSGWYVSLRAGNYELGLVKAGHLTISAKAEVTSTGFRLNLEVADVDALYQKMIVEGGHTELLGLRTEEFGQRHFIVEAPGGVLIDVITRTAPI